MSVDMDSKKMYDMYNSNNSYHTQYKDFFEDKDGYPNTKAYEHFAEQISTFDEDYYLACISVDLRTANRINYAYGNYVLRMVANNIRNSMDKCYIFRIQGDKFNVFINADSLEEFMEYVNSPKDYCDIYCGLAEEPYVFEKNHELIRKCVNLMYQDRFKKNNEKKSKNNVIYGDKGNTPVELQETETRKYRKTMWYSIIELKVKTPIYKEVTIYIYPTKLCRILESVPILVIVDDLLHYRVEYGKDIRIGVGGTKFTINARFNREGHFNVSFFKEFTGEDAASEEKNYEFQITPHEGECMPVNFGKRVGKDEIYPIKKNMEGLCEYVLFKNVGKEDGHDPQVVSNGIYVKDGIKYGVYIDNSYIDLIPID